MQDSALAIGRILLVAILSSRTAVERWMAFDDCVSAAAVSLWQRDDCLLAFAPAPQILGRSTRFRETQRRCFPLAWVVQQRCHSRSLPKSFSMSRATPPLRDLAARLIAGEAQESGSAAAAGSPPVFHVCERLRPHLATLMGKAGFRAVLARALAVAGTEQPWLAAVRVDAGGALAGWDHAEGTGEAQERAEGGVVLLAQLLGLLVAFIGESLTLRMLHEVWPNVPLSALHFTTDNHK